MFQFFLINFLYFFTLTIASHFLGGSFTYRHIEQPNNSTLYESILVELRFHISNHYFICTPEQINNHMIAYLIGEFVPYDRYSNSYLWYGTDSIRKNPYFYNIKCVSEFHNHACNDFEEKTWGYCESSNYHSGYSILRRQFLMIVAKYRPFELLYSACCWANSTNKNFYFNLFIETKLNRINSSPYPYIPASYYVDFDNPRDIKVFVYDADGDEIICERFPDDLGKFLTVHINNDCQLIYKTDQLGTQFGQFWLIDRYKSQNLSRSLISIQVHVLKNITCNIQPELIVENKKDHSNMSKIRIKESIYISVRINPNCPLIEPQDQTITELTTLCTNNQPIVLANGGIEVIFQCTPNLCEKYHVCFVGEFGFKLPSTKIQCFLIEVIGHEDECAFAMSNYDFLKPRNRYFIISEPIRQEEINEISPISSKSSTSILLMTKTALSLLTTTTTTTISLSSKSQSRKWLWISVALISFFLMSLIGYFGLKQLLVKFYSYSLNNKQFRSSSRTGSYSTIESDIIPTHPPAEQINTSTAPHTQYDNPSNASTKVKSRTQHIRLGPFDEDDL